MKKQTETFLEKNAREQIQARHLESLLTKILVYGILIVGGIILLVAILVSL